MIEIVDQMHKLSFSMLMDVCSESNRQDAGERYPDVSDFEGLRMVEEDCYAYLSDVFFTIKGAFYAVLSEKKKYLSVVRVEPYRDGFLVSGLETIANERNKGNAEKLLSGVLQHLENSGDVKVYSHVHKDNIASLRVHTACGFKEYLPYAAYIDGSVSQSAVTMLYISPEI